MTATVHVTLRYPNGRTHDEDVSPALPLQPGGRFELYGHLWEVVAWRAPRSRYDVDPTSFVCERADLEKSQA